MSNCKFLVHPVNDQSLMFTVNQLVPMYYGINDITFGTSGNILTVLKPFSNLFVLQTNQTGFSNIEPVNVNIQAENSLPNGLGFYKYNAITGRVTTTGNWVVGVRYVYNTGGANLYNAPIKYFNIKVRHSGTFIDNPLFEVITDNNGNQLLPINSGGQILVPITGSNGQPGYISSGFLDSGSGCVQTLSSGSLLPFNFCITGECPAGQTCAYVDSTGVTQEGGDQEPSQGGQKGDPINTLPLRIVANSMVRFDDINNPTGITRINSGCNFYTTMYIDTRDRTENFFLGRIGNRYVRLDTLTWSQQPNSGSNVLGTAAGVLRGINITKGLIHSINANREITDYTETEGTMYYVGNAKKPSWMSQDTFLNDQVLDAFTWGNLYQRDKGGKDIPVINTPEGFLRGFFVEKNIGIDDTTALRFSWCYGQSCVTPSEMASCNRQGLPVGNNWANANDNNFMGGQISFTLGELFRFDEIGGSLIENMQFNYNRVGLNYLATGNANVDQISLSAPWQDWGKTLKFTNVSDKFKHFYGLDWTFTRGEAPNNLSWRRFLTTGNTSFYYNLSPSYASSGNCVLRVPCPSCDPGCPCFTGHTVSNPDTVEICAANGMMAPRWLCACYSNPTINVSTTSSLTPEMFAELIN